MKKLVNSIQFIMLIILVFIILVLVNIIIQFKIDGSSININTILTQTVPSLTGAFFSGIIAIIIFLFTTFNEKKKITTQSNNSLEIINKELEENEACIISLHEALGNGSPNVIAKLINDEMSKSETPILNKFRIISSRLSTQTIDTLLPNLTSMDYLKIADKIKYTKIIIKHLDMLIQKDIDLENRVLLVSNTIEICKKFQDKGITISNPDRFSFKSIIENKDGIGFMIIFLIYLILTLIIN